MALTFSNPATWRVATAAVTQPSQSEIPCIREILSEESRKMDPVCCYLPPARSHVGNDFQPVAEFPGSGRF
jgi:hypothetical protein